MALQETCDTCNHSWPFHASGAGCKVIGCGCEVWSGIDPAYANTIGIDAAAEILDRSPEWVAEHAADLGGTLVDGALVKQAGEVWRFDPKVVRRVTPVGD